MTVTNNPTAKMLVSVGEKCACLKIAGRANFNSSVDFKALLDELLTRGFNYFALDLTECALMDSTFLGVLAGFGLKLNVPRGDSTVGVLELYNPNPRIAELLESLGVLQLFKVTQGDLNLPEKTTPRDHAPADASREEITRTCLEAHQTLMGITPENVSRFKDVARFLVEDLKKLKAGG